MRLMKSFFLITKILVLLPLCSTQENIVMKIGVIVDVDSLVGRMGLSCLSLALSDFYSLHSDVSTKLILHVRDSHAQVLDAAASGLSLLKDIKVDAIIGPQRSSQASFISKLGEKTQVPIVSFSATSPSLHIQSPYFIQAAQSDDAQVGAIAAIVEYFKWTQVVLIYEDSDYGHGITPSLYNALQEANIRVSYKSVIHLSATDDFIYKELYKMMTMQTRVFIVHLSDHLAASLFLKAREIGMMSEGYAWIVTSGVMDLLSSMEARVAQAMQGVIGVKPLVPDSKRLDAFERKWKRKFMEENPGLKQAELSVFGLWAYDTLWALALAAEKAAKSKLKPPKLAEPTAVHLADLLDLQVSEKGPGFLRAILKSKFRGLSGVFELVNGQLRRSSYQIINVVGKGEREVGIWTESTGISRDLLNKNLTSLKPIIWPGESSSVPKGWEVPVKGKKLRIGVPVKHGFTEFVKVSVGSNDEEENNNGVRVSGYYIDVFDSVMAALPYVVPYEYVPFEKQLDGGSYNDLVYQVYLQNYDGVVGDVTITSNRSKYVDFTLPFAEGGILCVVPIRREDENDKWIFLKPLKKELWLTSIALLFLTGFALWILEHRINAAFRGPPSEHVGMICYFPALTMVFAQSDRIVSNLARLVVTVWIFVVLILSSTYTASLSSRLTVQRLRPEFTDVMELIKKGHHVGCQQGSFIVDLLKIIGFEGSKIMTFKNPDDCDEALSRGSGRGGISAFFDVQPYTKLFVAKYCNKYLTLGPVLKTDGFAYVFPKGSPLVADVSRAIIELTESGRISEIELKWVPNPTCADGKSDSNISSSLSFKSFQSLFALTASVTVSSIFIFIITYLFKKKEPLKSILNSRQTCWSKFCSICRLFDERDAMPFRTRSNNRGSTSILPPTDTSQMSSPSSSPGDHCNNQPSSRISDSMQSNIVVEDGGALDHNNNNSDEEVAHITSTK